MSAKARITLWYTITMSVMLVAAMAFIIIAGGSLTRSSAAASIRNALAEAAAEIEYDDGELELDDARLITPGGVMICVYDAQGRCLSGHDPSALPFEDGSLRQDGELCIFDLEVSVPDYGALRLRGAAADAGSAYAGQMRLALIALPFLLLLAALGGYFITRRAFVPVERIAATAESISGGGDLTRRIILENDARRRPGSRAGMDELHRLAAAFNSMLDRLEASFEKEKRFTADASHELRTPVSVIIAGSDYALAHPEEAQRELKNIRSQAIKMSALLSQLLTLARADSSLEALQYETLDISELLEIIASQQQELYPRVRITVDAPGGLLMRADETLVMRMLINLIDNGARYGRGLVELSLRAEDGVIYGSVADDGPGILPEDREAIWQRFWRADPSRSGKGTGLGLSMVKWIVETHGGRISVGERPGGGASFNFALPQNL